MTQVPEGQGAIVETDAVPEPRANASSIRGCVPSSWGIEA
jgi:hypothetical protein